MLKELKPKEYHMIQIQHLLKLNDIFTSEENFTTPIQIQHLLKLNGLDIRCISLVLYNSNTTLVKVKWKHNNRKIRGDARFKYNTC